MEKTLLSGGTILPEMDTMNNEKENKPEQSQEEPSKEPQEALVAEEPKKEPTEKAPEPASPPTTTDTDEVPKDTKETEKPSKGKKPKGKQETEKKDSIKGKEKAGEKGKDENPDFKYIVRIANTNVDGNYTLSQGLTAIKGIGNRMAIIITDKLGLPRTKRIGDLSDPEVEKIIFAVENIKKEIPGWMMNRQKDFDSGEDIHIISSDISLVLRDDLNRLKKIRCYRGIRHEQGQKVRGQRTRANGRSGMTVGVQRKRIQQQQSKKSGK